MSAPAVLLPFQQAWVADESPVAVAEKSRRVGLSWSDAARKTLIAAKTSGMNGFYVGYNKDMAREYIDDCAFWAKHYNKAASEIEESVLSDEGKDILTFRIKFDSGHEIIALSSRPSNFRGMQGDATIDEAAFHDDLPGLLKAAMAFLIWGGRVRIISTHFGASNPFNELIEEIRAGKKKYSLHRITFDEAIEQGLYKRICLKTKQRWTPEGEAVWCAGIRASYGDDAEEELDCVPSQGTGVWLTRAQIQGCMDPAVPILRWALKPEFTEASKEFREAECQAWCEDNLLPLLRAMDPKARTYFGEDFARSGDLTVLDIAQEQSDLSLKMAFVVELRGIPFEQQRQIVFCILDRVPRFSGSAFDARGNGQYLAEVAMQRYGASRVLQVMISETWYREAMPKTKARVEDRSMSLPKDADTLDDFRVVRVVKGIAKVPDTRVKGREGFRHGDAAIAGAMLVWAVDQCEGGGPVEYESVSTRRDMGLDEEDNRRGAY